MKFAVVIPTYNRVDHLGRAVEAILQQRISPDIDLYCIISNTASTDATHEYLTNLKSNKIKFIIHSSLEDSTYINWRKSAEIIPDDIDWIWFHGDDDYFVKHDAIQIVCDQIAHAGNSKLTFIHACQARRSTNSGKVIEGGLLQLCNQIGYHEILGWMSSIVMKADRFRESILDIEQVYSVEEAFEKKVSAYSHSYKILEKCHSDDALFVDLPLIDLQDSEQTTDTQIRWRNEKIGERYFFVIDDLFKLKSLGILGGGLSFVFFRYLTGYFWDRYVLSILSDLIANNDISQNTRENLNRLKSISDLLRNPIDKKFFLEFYYSIEEKIARHLSLVVALRENSQLISNYLQFTSSSVFEFAILGGIDPNSVRDRNLG
jgi:glycosyltransferase involved in cell wall biosynthesis